MKKFIITESEKNEIREMYGLINEQTTLPYTVSGQYDAKNCDELHAFQSTSGKVVGNMNVTVGKWLEYFYNLGLSPKVTKVTVTVNGMSVSWSVVISKSDDGKAWVGFTSRGAGCNNDIIYRAESKEDGNDMDSAKSRIMSTYGENNIEIEKVNDFIYEKGKNSFKQIFYRYTKPKNFPPLGSQQPKGNEQKTTKTAFKEGQTYTMKRSTDNKNYSVKISKIQYKNDGGVSYIVADINGPGIYAGEPLRKTGMELYPTKDGRGLEGNMEMGVFTLQ